MKNYVELDFLKALSDAATVMEKAFSNIIDPSNHAALLERCREAASVSVLLTHEHFDHISGLNRIRGLCASSCRVIAGATCSERIQDIKANLSAYADVLAPKVALGLIRGV